MFRVRRTRYYNAADSLGVDVWLAPRKVIVSIRSSTFLSPAAATTSDLSLGLMFCCLGAFCHAVCSVFPGYEVRIPDC